MSSWVRGSRPGVIGSADHDVSQQEIYSYSYSQVGILQHYIGYSLNGTSTTGHETTAHSLGFTLALLAIHQNLQEKAFKELRSIVPEGDIPVCPFPLLDED